MIVYSLDDILRKSLKFLFKVMFLVMFRVLLSLMWIVLVVFNMKFLERESLGIGGFVL